MEAYSWEIFSTGEFLALLEVFTADFAIAHKNILLQGFLKPFLSLPYSTSWISA